MDILSRLSALRPRRLSTSSFSEPMCAPQPIPVQEIWPGREIGTSVGTFFLSERSFPSTYTHGYTTIGSLLGHEAGALALAARLPALADSNLRQLAFVDTETTGLAGGVGTYVFLVGVGSFADDGTLVLRQFFMRDFSEELAMLHELRATLAHVPFIVTFNGRAFDLPLLRSRFALSRLSCHLDDRRHVDLLVSARRIWGRALSSCALSALEADVLEVRRSSEDVPGYLIPKLYFDYLRTGNAAPLSGVFYHNLQDILSMVVLATRVCHAVEEPETAKLSAAEMLGVARLHEEEGALEKSVALYESMLEEHLSPFLHWEVRHRLSTLYKRAGRREAAEPIWRAMMDQKAAGTVDPYVELAKYYEWETGQLEEAMAVTEKALAVIAQWPAGPARRRADEELRHRLDRLRRKIGRQTGRPVKPSE